MRRFNLLLGILLLWTMFTSVGQAFADSPDDINLIVGGKMLSPDVPPQIIHDRTMVPIRIISEELGAKVDWDLAQQKVHISNGTSDITMWVGKNTAKVNGNDKSLDAPPLLKNDRTLVPIRFIAETLGTTVGWEQDTQTVYVNKVYSFSTNGNNIVNGAIYQRGQDLYVPLSKISSVVSDFQLNGDQIVYQGQTISLNNEGKSLWNARKMDTGWVVPLSVLENQLKLGTSVNGLNISVSKQTAKLLSINEENGHILIQTDHGVKPNDFTLDTPDRIVLDFPDTVLSDSLQNSISFNNGLGIVKSASNSTTSDQSSIVREIRLSQYSDNPAIVRVVVELTQKSKYQLKTGSNTIDLSLEQSPVLPSDPNADQPTNSQGSVVVIDAGHGGKDTGAVGATGDYEKDITLAIANMVTGDLKQDGVKVIETRDDDSYPTLQDRVDLANNSNADLFLSIHMNSFLPTAHGTEIWYDTPQSSDFANTLHSHLIAATGFTDRGVKSTGYYVIKNTKMPSSLVEVGFITNPTENSQLLNADFQQKVAKALADAINEYLTTHQK
jgi:N-acetylmuramoyl-L-alanine amidase